MKEENQQMPSGADPKCPLSSLSTYQQPDTPTCSPTKTLTDTARTHTTTHTHKITILLTLHLSPPAPSTLNPPKKHHAGNHKPNASSTSNLHPSFFSTVRVFIVVRPHLHLTTPTILRANPQAAANPPFTVKIIRLHHSKHNHHQPPRKTPSPNQQRR